MDIRKLKGSLDLAKIRATADPSESNLEILKQAQSDYEAALDPEAVPAEKKTDGEDSVSNQSAPVKPQTTEPITNNPLKTHKKVEPTENVEG